MVCAALYIFFRCTSLFSFLLTFQVLCNTWGIPPVSCTFLDLYNLTFIQKKSLGFRVLEFRILGLWGSGFGFGCRVRGSGLGFRVFFLGFRVWGLGFGFGLRLGGWGAGFGVQGPGVGVGGSGVRGSGVSGSGLGVRG